MKYTFLLPAYKAPFLRESLASILAQTYTDFRVIVSDDCSPEDLKSIVDEFADDERLTYRRNPTNIGAEHLTDHWNMLVDLCQTEWLILASDDDVYHPHFLEEIDRLQRKYPEVDLIRARCQLIDKNGEVTMREHAYDDLLTQADQMADFYATDHVTCVGNYVFRTAEMRAIGGFVAYPLAWCTDDMMTIRMAKRGMAVTADALFSFRHSGVNISTREGDRREQRIKMDAWLNFDNEIRTITQQLADDCRSGNVPPHTTPRLQRRALRLFNSGHRNYTMWLLINYGYVFALREVPGILRRYRPYFSSRYYVWLFCKKWLWHKMHKHR